MLKGKLCIQDAFFNLLEIHFANLKLAMPCCVVFLIIKDEPAHNSAVRKHHTLSGCPACFSSMGNSCETNVEG